MSRRWPTRLSVKKRRPARPCVKITYTGTMAIEGKGSMMGMEIFTEGKGTMSGTLYFDPSAGITVVGRVEDGIGHDGRDDRTAEHDDADLVLGTTTRTLRAVEESAK